MRRDRVKVSPPQPNHPRMILLAPKHRKGAYWYEVFKWHGPQPIGMVEPLHARAGVFRREAFNLGLPRIPPSGPRWVRRQFRGMTIYPGVRPRLVVFLLGNEAVAVVKVAAVVSAAMSGAISGCAA